MAGYADNLRDRPDHVAVRCGDDARTYRELHHRASRLASVLRGLGLSAGDRLAIMLPNSVEFVECLAASAKLECAALTVNWHLAPDELAHVLGDSGAGVLVAHADLRDVVDAAAPGCPVLLVGAGADDATDYESALAGAADEDLPSTWPTSWPVVYTSGTTGRPKGVVHGALASAEVLDMTQTMLAGLWGYGPEDVHVVAGPLYHAGPQGYANLTLFVGGTVVVMPEWDARGFCRTVQEQGVTTTFLTPAHFIRFLEVPEEERAAYDLGSLRHVLHAGAPCPRTVKERMIAALPGAEIWEIYGMSEGGATRVSAAEWSARPGTVGLPWPGTEIRILEPDTLEQVGPGETGLVYVRPAHGRFHYHGDEGKTAGAWHDDAFTVGDVGHLDEDGWLFLTDRRVDMVIKGGVNVYPRSVEEVLHRHPAVVDCAVFGVPHERDGEHLHAVVELREPTDPEELVRFTRANLDPWSCPSTVEVVDRLPRDPNGKVLKRQLRAAAWADAGRSI